MGRRLTQREIENKRIERAMKRLKSVEKVYGKGTTRSACQRYANREREQIRLEKEIQDREKELQRLKVRKK